MGKLDDSSDELHISARLSRETSTIWNKYVSGLLLVILLCLSYRYLPYELDDIINSCPAAISPTRNKSFESRADKLLTKYPLIDGHNDLAIAIRFQFNNQIYQHNFTHAFEKGGATRQVDLARLDRGKSGGAFWSLFMPCQKDIFDFSDAAYAPIVRATLEQLDLARRLSAAYPHYFTPPSNAKAALHAFQTKSRQLISPFAIEGLHQIGNSLSILRLYYSLGVRYATLTWNCHNAYADAAVLSFFNNGTSIAAPSYWGGVSPAGRNVIREMNRLGMLVDLSHVSAATMRDVLVGNGENESAHGGATWNGSIAPPIFSHSSAYALCPHPRNVPDAVLPLVKLRNSLIMVNFSPDFISCTAPPADAPAGTLPEVYPANATLAQVVRHIMHFGEKIGYAHVGIGTDYDGIEEAPRGLEDVSKFPVLVAELLRQGVSEKDVVKVMGGNLLRVWEEADAVSESMKREGVLPIEDELSRPWVEER